MNVKKEVTMNWNEAPDTITPEIYAQIRGRSIQWARDKFNEKKFPRLDGKLLIADKTAVKLYDLGINPKQNQKASVDYLILLELRKLNERKRTNENKLEEFQNRQKQSLYEIRTSSSIQQFIYSRNSF